MDGPEGIDKRKSPLSSSRLNQYHLELSVASKFLSTRSIFQVKSIMTGIESCIPLSPFDRHNADMQLSKLERSFGTTMHHHWLQSEYTPLSLDPSSPFHWILRHS